MGQRRLALDTSGQTHALVLLDGERAVASQSWAGARREGGPPLLARIQALTAAAGWLAGELDAIAVGRGPGSFTSLRVGLSAAVGLAYGGGAAIHLLDSLKILAAQAGDSTGAVRDAGHQEAYAWRRAQLDVQRLRVSELDGWLRPDDRIVADPAGRLATWVPGRSAAEVPEAGRRPLDAALAAIATFEFENGKAVRYDEVRPLYAQPAAAEARRQQ
jgi:tRNA threonylcarbamoyladenosine biosynthesis protein TsaB